MFNCQALSQTLQQALDQTLDTRHVTAPPDK